MWDQLRQRVAEDKNATYTFSQDFVSQTVCPIDEEEEKKKQSEESKAQWMTKRGFQYPKPKTRKELITHPQRPSEARIEDLKDPFQDQLDIKKAATHGLSPLQEEIIKKREHNFQTRFQSIPTFGALHTPEFEHEFLLRNIGDREELPRGKMVAGKEINDKFFRSVHLGGDDQAKIVEEAIKREKEEWKSKVVVDTLDFKVGGESVKSKEIYLFI